jgi:hypothetical protein
MGGDEKHGNGREEKETYPREHLPHVPLSKIVGGLVLAREETSTQGRVCDDGDPELVAGLDDFVSFLIGEKGELDLDGGNGGDLPESTWTGVM